MMKKLSAIHWLGIIIAVGIIALFVFAEKTKSESPVESKPKPEHDKIGAWVMCAQFIEDRLKSPGSANFGDDHTTHLGNGVYRCDGWVDSQNAFGAVLRNNFKITVKYMGSEKWRLVEGPFFSER